ncbi:hypothetical protein E4U43_002714 [Claviceps pusilla]|uniref:Uncharacterized protein n=1 Tax=Claviceps pusilla TaxID=123648 RepID=A0A9P7N674_9HYPO|nr:hypothetical protein E4U43_002714 [Claviceps pusilla]
MTGPSPCPVPAARPPNLAASIIVNLHKPNISPLAIVPIVPVVSSPPTAPTLTSPPTTGWSGYECQTLIAAVQVVRPQQKAVFALFNPSRSPRRPRLTPPLPAQPTLPPFNAAHRPQTLHRRFLAGCITPQKAPRIAATPSFS